MWPHSQSELEFNKGSQPASLKMERSFLQKQKRKGASQTLGKVCPSILSLIAQGFSSLLAHAASKRNYFGRTREDSPSAKEELTHRWTIEQIISYF